MQAKPIRDQILIVLDKLSPQQQKQTLDFVKRLEGEARPGIPGEILLQRARQLQFDPDDLKVMAAAIEEDCERIDWDGWE
jgi:hypothetical protein